MIRVSENDALRGHRGQARNRTVRLCASPLPLPLSYCPMCAAVQAPRDAVGWRLAACMARIIAARAHVTRDTLFAPCVRGTTRLRRVGPTSPHRLLVTPCKAGRCASVAATEFADVARAERRAPVHNSVFAVLHGAGLSVIVGGHLVWIAHGGVGQVAAPHASGDGRRAHAGRLTCLCVTPPSSRGLLPRLVDAVSPYTPHSSDLHILNRSQCVAVLADTTRQVFA